MSIVSRLKRFILGGEEKKSFYNARNAPPSIVKLETDVNVYWTLKNVIGDGAFGNVYKAVNKQNPSLIAAAKAIDLDDEESTDVMVEVAILAHCNHANIVQIYDAYTMGNRITLLLEYCGGGAVDSIMMELSRGLNELQIQYIMKEILKALCFLHETNIIHRDLKAGNVLMTEDARVKLADFGVSAFCKETRDERSTFIGTPYWMAPEVMLCETFPEKRYNKSADIWSFGITLIEMAEEKPPYAEMNPAKVIFKVIKADPPTLESPHLWSQSFQDVISKCLVKDLMYRITGEELLSLPFFAEDGYISEVQRLLCEVHAENVTTEFVESDIEEDGDTLSVDVVSTVDVVNTKNVEIGSQEALASGTNENVSNTVSDSEASLPVENLPANKEYGVVIEQHSSGSNVQTVSGSSFHIDDDELVSHVPVNSGCHSAVIAALSYLDNLLEFEEAHSLTASEKLVQQSSSDVDLSVNDATETNGDMQSHFQIRNVAGQSEQSTTVRILDEDDEHDVLSHSSEVTCDAAICASGDNARAVHTVKKAEESISKHIPQPLEMIFNSTDFTDFLNPKFSPLSDETSGNIPVNEVMLRYTLNLHFKETLLYFGKNELIPQSSKDISVASETVQYFEKQPKSFVEEERLEDSLKTYRAFLVQSEPSNSTHDTTPTTSLNALKCLNDGLGNNVDYFGIPLAEKLDECYQCANKIRQQPLRVKECVNNSIFATIPPPEPPVDYPAQLIEQSRVSLQNPNPTSANSVKENVINTRKSPHRQTVTKKTRVYMVDGVQMTSTSHQVFGVKQDFDLRRQQLHDLRRLQRDEIRQQRELNAKLEAHKSEQAKRFSIEKDNVIKASEAEMLALARTQKRQMKDCEDLHADDMKQTIKRIQSDQERELRTFRESLKFEQKQLKIEMDAMPKSQRKDLLRFRREQLEKEQMVKEAEFVEQQQSNQNVLLMRVQLAHKLKILQLEKTFQQQKHAVSRSREASEWELEERQLAERYQLYKQELRDRFLLQRTQMLARHQRELEHMRKVNEMNEEEAARNYASYKKRLPKDFRTESKTRIAMFKESLRISCQGEDPVALNEKLRIFEEKEKSRIRNAIENHEAKAARKLFELREKNATAIKELEELHNEKRKMLLEAEQNKMNMYEEEYEQVVSEWKSHLPVRKQDLEAQFSQELDELDAFYRRESAQLQSINSKSLCAQLSF